METKIFSQNFDLYVSKIKCDTVFLFKCDIVVFLEDPLAVMSLYMLGPHSTLTL